MSLSKLIKFKNGFTLIELIITISIIGILAGGTIVIINPAKKLQQTRDTQRKYHLTVIRKALEEYYYDHGEYPNTHGYYGSAWVVSTTNPPPWIPGLDATYIKTLPKDPKNSGGSPFIDGGYSYAYSSNGPHYNLVAQLENTTDPDRCELKQHFWVKYDNGIGQSWCETYSKYIYAVTDLQ